MMDYNDVDDVAAEVKGDAMRRKMSEIEHPSGVV